MNGGQGINRLARVTSSRMAQHAVSPAPLELGTIQADGSLKLDTFGVPIPKKDYLIGRSLTLPDPMTMTAPGDSVTRPQQLAPPKAGDRVLVAWLNGGSDVVIIDVVVSADA